MLVAGATGVMAGQKNTMMETAIQAEPEDPVVATINKEPVSAREYRLVMELQVAVVYSLFKEKQNLDDHLGYWNESSGPTGPLAKLREVVRGELIKIKVYQGLAKEKGMLNETTYSAFHAEFTRENARRTAALGAGQAIYGPPQYRETPYYYIRLGDLVYKLKQAISKEHESKITESEIGKYYDENKASFGDKSLSDARQEILTVLSVEEAGKEIDALCASAKVEVSEHRLRSIVPRSDPETAAQNPPTKQQ